ncbi:hypothetical protein ACT2VT_001929 [Pantoea agglomerans]
MKILFRATGALLLSAGLCASAFAIQPVSDTGVSQKLDQLNATVQVIDSRLQQIFTQLTMSTQTGACWLDGKAYSQGTEVKIEDRATTCSVQPKTGWPQWQPVAGRDGEGPVTTGSLSGTVSQPVN